MASDEFELLEELVIHTIDQRASERFHTLLRRQSDETLLEVAFDKETMWALQELVTKASAAKFKDHVNQVEHIQQTARAMLSDRRLYADNPLYGMF